MFWHQFPVYDVTYRKVDRYGDPQPMTDYVAWCIVAGSDLQLQCERQQIRADTEDRWKELLHSGEREQWIVRTYDGDGNDLNVLGQFRSPGDALAALPSLLTVAHMLYPNFLLMARDAEDGPPAATLGKT